MSTRAAAFAALRSLFPNIWNTPGTIAEMNELMDAAGVPESARKPGAPSLPESFGTPNHTGKAGVDLIKQFEGCARMLPDGRITAYPDPGTGNEPWTIGWGSTWFEGRKVRKGLIISQKQADNNLIRDLRKYEADVIRALGDSLAGTSQAQFDALVSFHYNTGAIGRATLTRKHVAHDFAGAAAEFARWNKAGGRILKGLTRRRAAEAALYRSGM